MKKYMSIAMAAVLASLSLSACGGESKEQVEIENEDVALSAQEESVESAETAESAEEAEAAVDAESGKKLKIVTTIFPEYDWVKQIVGENNENVQIEMLLDNGVDLHSYQPTAEDVMNISDCDMFIYVGGESDEWVDDALKEKVNDDMVVLNLLEIMGDSVKEEEVVEGMEAEEEEHEHGDAEDEDSEEHEDGEEEEEVEYDEHVWLSLKNAATICNKIAESLETIDLDNAETHKNNAASYTERLLALDSEYAAAVSAADKDTVLFGDRFPFRYMVDDYNLNYYAAFVGCSAETEASFETIVFLSGKVDELGLGTVLTIEGDNHKIAETIIQNTTGKDQNIRVMDSMQSTTSGDVENGASYLVIMEDNLEVLKEALK